MKKSTKVLLILLGCVVVAAGILIMIYRDQIFAQTTTTPIPDPTDNTSTSEQTEAYQKKESEDKDVTGSLDKNAAVGPCEWQFDDGGDTADSGLKMHVGCKNPDEVNAAPLNGNTFSLTFDFSFTFTKACNEYISKPLIFFKDGDQQVRMDKIAKTTPSLTKDLELKENGDSKTWTGTFKRSFVMEERYLVYFELPVWASRVGINDLQKKMYSNACYLRRMPNPEDTKGKEIAVSDDKGVTGSLESECKKECAERQDCGDGAFGVGGNITDPICNGFCSMSCAIMDMVAGLFNFSFGILHKAVGLS